MELQANAQERPDVSAEERASHDLIKRILKLRWMGMEAEAEQMQVLSQHVEPACTLLPGPCYTD
jgi:hypothetical protein